MSERASGAPAAPEPAPDDTVGAAPGPHSPLFHFAEPAAWADAQVRGVYQPAGLAEEGFIHCATAAQIPGVIARHLRGRGPRVRLQLDPARLQEVLKWEWSTASHDLYPHLFAAVPLDAVVAAEPFDPDAA